MTAAEPIISDRFTTSILSIIDNLLSLSQRALLEDRCTESLGLYRTSLLLARESGDRLEIGFEVQGVGMSQASRSA